MLKQNPWKTKIIPHPVQQSLIQDQKRFKVVAAGRRSGKTFRAKRNLVLEALWEPGLYFAAAPTAEQARGIFWEDLKGYCSEKLRAKQPNETRATIYLRNGSEIRVIGLDKPARFEGQPWTGGVIDEFDDLKEDTWRVHVRPALDTIGLDTWCWICGVPNGLYLLYELKDHAINFPEHWSYYHWVSEEILSASVIEQAKRDLSPLQYRQEYLASFETAMGRVYPDYDTEKNSSDKEVDLNRDLIWTHDFNFSPQSSAIIQEHNGCTHVVDEIVLESASTKNVAIEFVNRYRGHKKKRVFIYGDSSGHAGEKHNNPTIQSNYVVIKRHLMQNGWDVHIKTNKANPLIIEGQNSLNGRICNAHGERRFFVNQKKCKYAHSGLAKLQLKKGSQFQEKEADYQHITTALRYYTYVRFPVRGALELSQGVA